MFWPRPNTKNTSNKDPNPNSCHDTRMVGGQSNSHLFCGPSSHCCWKLSLASKRRTTLRSKKRCRFWHLTVAVLCEMVFLFDYITSTALENVRVELDYGFVWDWSISKVAHAASLWIQSILHEAIQSLLSLCLDLFPKSHDLFKNFWMSQQMPSKDVLFLHYLKSLA